MKNKHITLTDECADYFVVAKSKTDRKLHLSTKQNIAGHLLIPNNAVIAEKLSGRHFAAFLSFRSKRLFQSCFQLATEGLLGRTAEKRDTKYCESLVKGKGGEGVERSNMGSEDGRE